MESTKQGSSLLIDAPYVKDTTMSSNMFDDVVSRLVMDANTDEAFELLFRIRILFFVWRLRPADKDLTNHLVERLLQRSRNRAKQLRDAIRQ